MRNDPAIRPAEGSAAEVFAAFLRLGLTSFGGPVAHLGYFRAAFVQRRAWLDEASYADLVALCQFLPGPASSQVGMAIGLLRAGVPGMLAAWAGFTLPSAVAMALFAAGVARLGPLGEAGWLRGLQLVAVAVVAQAVWGMARTLCPDRQRASVAVAAVLVVAILPSAAGQILALLMGAGAGLLLPRDPDPATSGALSAGVLLHRGWAGAALAAFAALLVGLPLAADLLPAHGLRLFAVFYRTGALVFGGGHVVLPLLQAAVVPPGWVGADSFLAGYGAAQAMPGPLFTFAAYLGAAEGPTPHGWAGALIATLAIFLPSFLLVGGTLPFWDSLRRRPAVQAALRGVNAAVVGVLAAALYTPVWTSSVHNPAGFAVALVAFLLLTGWRAPPWLVVALGAAAGEMLTRAGVAL